VTDPNDTTPPTDAEDTGPQEPLPHACTGPCDCPVARAEYERKTAGWL
jgi:hypothetical protein